MRRTGYDPHGERERESRSSWPKPQKVKTQLFGLSVILVTRDATVGAQLGVHGTVAASLVLVLLAIRIRHYARLHCSGKVSIFIVNIPATKAGLICFLIGHWSR